MVYLPLEKIYAPIYYIFHTYQLVLGPNVWKFSQLSQKGLHIKFWLGTILCFMNRTFCEAGATEMSEVYYDTG